MTWDFVKKKKKKKGVPNFVLIIHVMIHNKVFINNLEGIIQVTSMCLSLFPPSLKWAYGLYQGGVEFDRNCTGRLSIWAVGGNLFLPPPHSQGAWRRKLRCRFDLAGRIVETTISMYLTKPSFYDPTQLYLYFRVSLSWPCLREHSVLR